MSTTSKPLSFISPDDPFWDKLTIPDSGTVITTPPPPGAYSGVTLGGSLPGASFTFWEERKDPKATLPVENSPFIQLLEDGIPLPPEENKLRHLMEMFNAGLLPLDFAKRSLSGKTALLSMVEKEKK